MILFINACVRKESRTRLLTEYLLKKFNDEIKEINLEKENILPLDSKTLDLRTKLAEAGTFDNPIFNYAKDFATADTIVIAAPFWDLSFPSSLKCYIEAINIIGLTFAYSSEGIPYGLCKAKKLYYVTTSGGKIFNDEYSFGYIKSLCNNFYGIKDVSYIKAENLDVIGSDVENILRTAEEEIAKQIQ
ncbi:NAD(P)H-dependent oxidoreductase [bacterium]|nr:NAD(P)H-dependent oxidoreductase [bacterium]